MTLAVAKKLRVLADLTAYRGDVPFPFEPFFDVAIHPSNMTEKTDALVIWGGADIHPSYYGQDAHRTNDCWGQAAPGRRDQDEWHAIQTAIRLGVPIIGICRGAQMACAAAGGILIQHTTGHNGGSHALKLKAGNTWISGPWCKSYHHQMMYPFDVPHEMLAVSYVNMSKTYEGLPDGTPMPEVEPEVVWFPKIKALAVQSHPEWHSEHDAFMKYFYELLEKYIVKHETEEVVV